MEICRRGPEGQSIVETTVGITIIILVVLALLDIAVLVLANHANDNLANTACRAAAGAFDSKSGLGSAKAGFAAARAAADSFASSAIVSPDDGKSFLTGYCWNGLGTPDYQGSNWPSAAALPDIGAVGVVTTVKVTLPVPFPFLPSSVKFQASAMAPIVALPPGDVTGGGGAGPGEVRGF